MPTLATLEHCTGCGACSFVCPKQCIAMRSDAYGIVLPHIDTTLCIECHACERSCPALNQPIFNVIQTAYAAWNKNKAIRRHCASGGVSSAMYEYALKKGISSIGAILDMNDATVHVIPLEESRLESMQNSKYCFSDARQAFQYIRGELKRNKTIIAIGLPCQIAAYKKVFGNKDNIVYVDLVCHGVAPAFFLKQHINHIESQTGVNARKLSFRAPEKGTANYYLTLYNNDGRIFYSKRSADGDTYNIAFHRCLFYRENCYHCHYARPERCSDITLGDYHGLGEESPCSYSADEVSVILVNTDKGKRLIDALLNERLIFTEKRPTDEPVKGDAQLRRPSPKPIDRANFEKYIIRYNGDFERTMAKILQIQNRRQKTEALLSLPQKAVRKCLKVIGLR